MKMFNGDSKKIMQKLYYYGIKLRLRIRIVNSTQYNRLIPNFHIHSLEYHWIDRESWRNVSFDKFDYRKSRTHNFEKMFQFSHMHQKTEQILNYPSDVYHVSYNIFVCVSLCLALRQNVCLTENRLNIQKKDNNRMREKNE